VLGKRSRAHEVVAGTDVAERAGEGDRLPVAALADGRRPDGELEIGSVTSSSCPVFSSTTFSTI
jgi:hypothetical protein